MAKTFWRVTAIVLSLSLAGCEGSPKTAAHVGPAAAAPSLAASALKPSVIVTWQPQDKQAEFLSGFRPKE